MSLMDWGPELDIGVNEMNHQHQDLLSLMNRLHQLWLEKANRSEQADALEKLKLMTVRHFKEEEDFQESIGWAKLATHKIIHTKLLETFAAHEAKFKSGQPLDMDFFNFLQFWLASHIKGIDKEYGTFAKSKSA